MAYEVLARKWRPQRFSELVGQDHISRTLKNAIARKRVAHAYLFVGGRGVGKTTSARLFAKSLNCTNLLDGEPCCKCESCHSIASGNSLDVIEIDGASNNGVDSIRDLRENTQYTPVSGNFKIYIIDEVHMLSASAWNALLKTLEEPPAHVKFIFATTEAHKVLPTVVSRCQRFDFKSIPSILISQKLRQIADFEHIYIDEMALTAIARAADGGMRDAQSIFDQMIAFCGGLSVDEMISEHDVVDVFGLVSSDDLVQLVISLFTNNTSSVLSILNNLASAGRDLERLYADLLLYLRNLTVVQNCNNSSDILEISDIEMLKLQELSTFPTEKTGIFLDHLVSNENRLRSALNKRVYLEMVLIRAMKESQSININDIIASFEELKNSKIPRDIIIEKNIVNFHSNVNVEEKLSSQVEVLDKDSSNNFMVHQDSSYAEMDEKIVANIENADIPANILEQIDTPIEDLSVINEEEIISDVLDDKEVYRNEAISLWSKLIKSERLRYLGDFLKCFTVDQWQANVLYVSCDDLESYYSKKGLYDINEVISDINAILREITGLGDAKIEFMGALIATMNVVEVPHDVKERIKGSKLVESVVHHFSGEIKDIRS